MINCTKKNCVPSTLIVGLYDKPVVIEGKRERKTTVFLASQTPPAVSHQPKPLLFEVSMVFIRVLTLQSHSSHTQCMMVEAVWLRLSAKRAGLRVRTHLESP